VSAPSYAIDVRDLSKTLEGRLVVNHVDVRVQRGKIYGFLGPNGSGKTTTIRMLCGLLTPDAGEGTCLGLDLRKDLEQIRLKVGYMTQKFSFWEDLTIEENLNFVASVFGMDTPKERVRSCMERFNLAARAHQLAGALSGGWKQRLALAACVLHEPELLLLDEPTAGVDPKARKEFWDEIRALAARGLTVLVSTHYMDEAERCDQILYVAYGNIMAEGTVEEILQQSGFSSLEDSFIYYVNQAMENQP
jgi:ABC-2 type transport system ATP-binding protein